MGLILASGTMIAFSDQSAVIQPREIGLSFFSFFQNGFSAVGGFFTGTFNSIAELRALRDDYEKAKIRLRDLEGVERNLSEIVEENRLLNEQLQFSQQLELKHIPAQIIAKDPVSSYSSLTINKGFLDGLKRDMPVIAYQKGLYGLVGKVISVGLGASQVIPLPDPGSFIAARFQDTRYEGLVQGKGDISGKLTMSFVKKRAKEEIKFGDLVITSGMSGIYPRGISIGRISGIRSRDYETSLDLELDPVIDFSKLEFVYVLDTAVTTP